jgi:adenine-specific DNA methylase
VTQSKPKRLIEVDLPIRRISQHSRREKSIRHGHISTLHIWWARRPLAACRAVILAALWPDPADPRCPASFREVVHDQVMRWARDFKHKAGAEFGNRLILIEKEPSRLRDLCQLRDSLLDFIAEFANWDNAHDGDYLSTAREITRAAHAALGGAADSRPLVLDPFAGGGAIPLEAIRVGADAFAADLNPVAVTLNRVVLEDLPRFGEKLVSSVRECGEWISKQLADRVAKYYPVVDGKRPIAYLFARSVLSEAPGGGIPIELPLIRSMWLGRRRGRGWALRWARNNSGTIILDTVDVEYADGSKRKVRRPRLEIADLSQKDKLDDGVALGGAATCPITGYTTPVESVRAQLKSRNGGTHDARLIAVVVDDNGRKAYRVPTEADHKAVAQATSRAKTLQEFDADDINHLRGFINIVLYGIARWRDAFSPRQTLVLATLSELVREAATASKDRSESLAVATARCLALAVDRQADYNSALCTWRADHEKISHTFSQGQALPMRLDYVEVNPLSGSSGDWSGALDWVLRVCETVAGIQAQPGRVAVASATTSPLPDDSCDAVVSDPPYYAAVPYADLSDFFYTRLRQTLAPLDPSFFREVLTPKKDELVSLAHRAAMYREKDGTWFEEKMGQACLEARRVVRQEGIGVWVFANKETEAWEKMLAALVNAGWVITASWPIDTEMEARLRARNSAALASSVHIVCRPRSEEHEAVGEWRVVLAELPRRMHDWMPRLAQEGVVGADAIFACLGPALEIFSRHERVEKASGEPVLLKEYLEHVWTAVSKEALAMIFRDADATGFEEDARLSAMWLWTLSTGGAQDQQTESDIENDDDAPPSASKTAGFSLEFDAARKIAQGLGAHLEELGSLVEVKGETARLLSVAERARALFPKGDEPGTSPKKAKKKAQTKFDFANEKSDEPEGRSVGSLAPPKQPGASVLDRVHQAMLLFSAGRGDAIRRFLVDDGVGRDDRFWRLAQALSALYPSSTDEKRWVDGVLARKKGLGF